jgi:ribosomal protein S18 acetylase RimI-like enzyme
MFEHTDYVIRPLTPADEPLLWEMVYQGAQAIEGEGVPPEIVQRPEFARHVTGWGQSGDTGFVAHDLEEGKPLGAAWFRHLPAHESASEQGVTAELAFAVVRGHRRRGIGAALLTQLVKANPEHACIRISAPASNPAVRLYERFGFGVVQEGPNSVTMRRDI